MRGVLDGHSPSPTARPSGVRPGRAVRFLWARGVREWGPVTNPTAHTLESWHCALSGQQEAIPGQEPRASASGVRGWVLSLSRTPVLGACARSPLPTGLRCAVPALASALPTVRVAQPALRSVRAAGVRLWGCQSLGWVFLGTLFCAVVRCMLCALARLAALGGRFSLAPVHVPWLWPAACLSGVTRGPAGAPLLVQSGRSPCSGWLPCRRGAVPYRRLSPPRLLRGCAGRVHASQEPSSCCLPLAPAKAGAQGLLRVVPVQGRVLGLSLAGPSGVGLRLRAVRWLGLSGPSHSRVQFPVPSVF